MLVVSLLQRPAFHPCEVRVQVKQRLAEERRSGGDEILKSLARGTKTVTREYSNTTAQPASCHQASLTYSNQLNINHSLARIAYGVS